MGTLDKRTRRSGCHRRRLHKPCLLLHRAGTDLPHIPQRHYRARKKDLEAAANRIDATLKLKRGKAFISVNKALVTQASSAIPVVPLYISILYKVMKEKGVHEGCIEQIQRLFSTQLYNDNCLDFDDDGRVRIDNLELRDDVQKAVFEIWPKVTTENLNELTDFAGYKKEFLKLFGFGLPNVDYKKDVEI